MEIITIVVGDHFIHVVDGKVKSARLKYEAPNLRIYIFGRVPAFKRDKVMYHAFEQARARHIPLKQLQSYGWT